MKATFQHFYTTFSSEYRLPASLRHAVLVLAFIAQWPSLLLLAIYPRFTFKHPLVPLVSSMLLVQGVAFCVAWPPPSLRFILRLAACAWIVFVLVYAVRELISAMHGFPA